MFDYHMHSAVSYDGHNSPEEMARAAVAAGLQEICFTDHLDYQLCRPRQETAYSVESYNTAYGALEIPGLTVRNGAEVGLAPWNREELHRDLSLRHYDFILGSVHFIDDVDPWYPEFWKTRSTFQAEREYLLELLKCVQVHEDFDVLGHLTYISKGRANPNPRPLPLAEHREVVEEIMKTLIVKGKGMECNTSGVDRIGVFLPDREYFELFRQLGGEIVTVGSDAHNPQRVGQYNAQAMALLKEIFGHVCTFADRKPIFHKL